MPAPYSGGCQCGAVRYQVTVEPLTLYRCHCTDCQKQSGSAFGLSMVVPIEGFVIVQGAPNSFQKIAESGNPSTCHYCPSCGTRLYHQRDANPGVCVVKPGTLDDTSWLAPIGNMWTRSAQPGSEIDPEMVNYEKNPEGFDELIARWRETTRA